MEKKRGKLPLPPKATDGATLSVRVQPSAGKNELVEIRDEIVKIRINAPPVDGKANRECIKFLAKVLGVASSQVSITGGEKGRSKVIRIAGLDQDSCWQRLRLSLSGR